MEREKKQRSYKKTLLFSVMTVLFATLLFGVLLVFTSAYFREREHREISDAILNKCIQETDGLLSSVDRMVTEFLLDNSHINEFMVTGNIERIEEYKMKQSLNRFNNNLNYFYGNAVSLYLFAPRSDRLYLNGALYRYSTFGHVEWINQFLTPPLVGEWVGKDRFLVYNGYETFVPSDSFVRYYDYPIGTNHAVGTACALIPERMLGEIVNASLPTSESQIYVLDRSGMLLYDAGKDPDAHYEEMTRRKDSRSFFQWPYKPSFYTQTSPYTDWTYVVRIPKSGMISLWSPLGSLYALAVLLYCAGISMYLVSLFRRPYRLVEQLVRRMRETIPRSGSGLQADEFLALQAGFEDLNRDISDLRSQMDVYRFEVCDELILDLITSDRITSYEVHEQKMREAGLRFYTNSYMAVLISHTDGTPVLSGNVHDRIAPLRDERIGFLCTQADPGTVLLLLTSAYPLEGTLKEETLARLLAQFEEENIILGLGTACDKPQELVSSYDHAKKSVQYAIRHQLSGLVDHTTLEEDGHRKELGERIRSFIEENYSDPAFSLKLMETHFSMTGPHLSRVFKECTGETIQNELTRLRVEAAEKRMEENPKEPLEQVAEQVGYVNVQALNRAFKKIRGMPPRTSSKSQNA